MTELVITPQHDNLYAVEEITVFRNVYLVRAADPMAAETKVKDNQYSSFLQNHVSSEPSQTYRVETDADIVKIMQSTEQPDMTLESFTNTRGRWLSSLVIE